MTSNEREQVASRPEMSDDERETLLLIAGGATNRDLADALEVSTSTVGRSLTALFRKIGARDRVHATTIALVAELINPEDVRPPGWVRGGPIVVEEVDRGDD